MIDIPSWITGLMAENYEALGFIPNTTIRDRYVDKRQYVLQEDEKGHYIGYLLHGPIRWGRPVIISQHCIQYEKRLQGYGINAFDELKRRADLGGSSSIILRCATDLSAVLFWQSIGFQIIDILPGGVSRNRLIAKMVYFMNLPLLK